MQGIGNRIQSIRKKHQLSQTVFGQETGCSLKTIARYEKEDNFPDLDFIYKLITKFNINPYWLLTGEGRINNYSKQELSAIESFLSDDDIIGLIESIKSDPILKTILLSLFQTTNNDAEIERQLNILRASLKK